MSITSYQNFINVRNCFYIACLPTLKNLQNSKFCKTKIPNLCGFHVFKNLSHFYSYNNCNTNWHRIGIGHNHPTRTNILVNPYCLKRTKVLNKKNISNMNWFNYI